MSSTTQQIVDDAPTTGTVSSTIPTSISSSRRSPNLESRPVPQDIIKRMSLLQRFVARTSIGFGKGMHPHPTQNQNQHHRHRHNPRQSNHHQQNHHQRATTTTTTMMQTSNTTSTSTSASILDGRIGSSITITDSSDSTTTDDTVATEKCPMMAMTDEQLASSKATNEKLLILSSSIADQPFELLPTTPVASISTATALQVMPVKVQPIVAAVAVVDVVVENIMQWMESEECPDDILPLILAYAGPKKTTAISTTNKYWSSILNQESTWRRLCEELYKWKEGDAVPVSWKKYYTYNPCVPIDYSTIHAALNSAIEKTKAMNDATATASSSSSSWTNANANPVVASASVAADIRILIRPGCRYVLREAITIDEDINSTVSSVTIETMDYYPAILVDDETTATGDNKRSSASSLLIRQARPTSLSSKRKRISTSIRKIFKGCRTDDTIAGTTSVEDNGDNNNEDENYNDDDEDDMIEGGRNQQQASMESGTENDPMVSTTELVAGASEEEIRIVPPPQATLVLRTRRHNEPLIRIRQGSCTIRNIKIKHICHGTDIWNGNAGIQIQPPIIDPEDNNDNTDDVNVDDDSDDDNDEESINPPSSSSLSSFTINTPTVTLDRVDVSSSSGRGIVNIDGGTVNIHNSYVHDCAATGIYVGGPGSRARIERSDVLNNGTGNRIHPRRGIPRGHSGIYLEQGYASIINCNISQNSLTGISAISSDNARLSLEDSDLVSNGTFQLEMPANGTVAHRNSSISRNNHFAAGGGLGRSRSGLF